MTMLIAVRFTSYYESFSSLFMTVKSQCPIFSEYQALYPSSTRLQTALCNFHAAIVRCCKHVVEMIQRSWTQHLKKAIFQSFQDEMKADMQSIQIKGQEVKQEIFLAAARAQRDDAALQAKERKAASQGRSMLRNFIPKAEREFREMRDMQMQQLKRRTREESQRLLESVSSHDYSTPFREACKKRRSGTATWILEVPEFKSWHQGNGPPLLWCSGKIGSGKTILCSHVVNYIFRNKSDNDKPTFFFIDRGNHESLQAETMIRSIIRQSIESPAVLAHVRDQLEQLDQAIFCKLGEWTDLLIRIIQYYASFYIVIDGIDECEGAERRAALDALSSIIHTAKNGRIFLSSRDSVHLDLQAGSFEMHRVAMSCEVLMPDIRSCVELSIEERLKRGELAFGNAQLLIEVRDTLTQHADGMFLWVTFLIDEICTGDCDDDIRQALRSLPKDLHETFNRALSRIMAVSKHPKLVQKAFRWIAAAKRPMSLEELREAVSIEIGQVSSRPERMPQKMDRIVLWSENLLYFTEEEPVQVHFAHASIRDFVTRQAAPPQLSDFHVDVAEADHFAGEICVTYLHFSDFTTTIARRQTAIHVRPADLAAAVLSQTPKMARASNLLARLAFRNGEDMTGPDLNSVVADHAKTEYAEAEELNSRHPFLKYAAKYWFHHSVHFQEKRSTTWKLWLDIITGDPGLAEIPWPQSLMEESKGLLYWSIEKQHSALILYACGGEYGPRVWQLVPAVAGTSDTAGMATLLETVHCSQACLDLAFLRACKEGQVEMCELLLQHGASLHGTNLQALDVDDENKELQAVTPLEVASIEGDLRMVKKLIAYGADVNAAPRTKGGYRPLQAACGAGHVAIVDQLLSAGADVNAAASDKGGRTALQAACAQGFSGVVERLLAAGADINGAPASSDGMTALHAAAGAGHVDVVVRLLDAGADVHDARSRCSKYYTALFAAVTSGHVAVVNRLLAAGEDANATLTWPSGRFCTPLLAAAEIGPPEMVDALIAGGANANATYISRRGRGFSPLRVAAEAGQTEVVERLLAAGADMFARDPDGERVRINPQNKEILRRLQDLVILLVLEDFTL